MQIIRVKGINGLGKTNGCEKAPSEVLEKLKEIKTNEKGKIIDKSLFDLEEIHLNNNNVEEANELIYKNSKKIFSEQDKALFVGGDHSISYPLVKGFMENFENPFLIVFDAHADCMKPGKEPTHEEWLRALIEKGFPKGNVILMGVRNVYPEETSFLKKNNVTVIEMKEIFNDVNEICDVIMERARNSDALYVSIDIDVLDPAYAPGTGYLEPGGISSRELIYFIQRLTLLNNFKGADIVEINPDIDKGTVKVGAKLLAEMI